MSRVVLVVGASSGIGRSTAQQLARRGDHLELLARSAGPLEAAAAECRARGAAAAVTHRVDINDRVGVVGVVDDIVARRGRIDAVVCSAGVVAYGRFDEVPGDVWDKVITTNVLGTANVARAVLPAMRRSGQGTLVLIGSVVGQIAVPGMSAYAVSKWGIRSLGRELVLDNKDVPGIHVCVVSPGGVDTPIYRQAANVLGREGLPPPPVYSTHRVAQSVVGALDRPRARISVGWSNPLMRLGFSALPGLFDLLVGPLFSLLANGEPLSPTRGNVDGPVPDLEAVDGGYLGNARLLARAVRASIRSIR